MYIEDEELIERPSTNKQIVRRQLQLVAGIVARLMRTHRTRLLVCTRHYLAQNQVSMCHNGDLSVSLDGVMKVG